MAKSFLKVKKTFNAIENVAPLLWSTSKDMKIGIQNSDIENQ